MSEAKNNIGGTDLHHKAAKHQQLAIQHFRAGDLQIALREGRAAADIDTNNIQLQNLVGAIALETGDANMAIGYFQRALSLNDDQAEAHYLLGNAQSKLTQDEAAIASYKKALTLDPSHANAAMNLGFCYERVGELGDAERAFRRAVETLPDHPEANNALANLYVRKTQYDKAEQHARRAVTAAPSIIEMNLTLAKALRFLNRHAEAEAIYRTAMVIHPHNSLLLIELGSVLREQHKFDEAETVYKKAVELAPKNKHTLRAAASYHQSVRKFAEAAELYERFLEIAPEDAAMLNNMAIVKRENNLFDEAEQYYLRAIDFEEKPSYVYNNIAILAMEMAKPVQSIEYYKSALEIDPRYSSARSNMLFYMNYLEDMSAEELFREHLEWPRWHAEPLLEEKCVHGNDPTPDRRLKIGYLSADLYGHAVSYFIEAALKHHDREMFDVHCYANVTTPDGITKRLKSYVDHWYYIDKMKDEEICDLIRQDGIDILVDLGGHTAGHRLNVIAQKPAPIQVTWIGYPNTSGLDTVDYRFVDNITDPAGDADKLHTEQLWRLPRSFTCYLEQSNFPVAEDLAALGTGQVTFGSFNNASKISPSSIATWARILNRVEGARLILKSGSLVDEGTQKRFHDQFKAHGIPANRIELLGKVSSEEHLRLYDKIDIGLDPFPYNGTTTTCEAMYMGVPVICLLGDRHAARVTGSLMTQVGLADLVAQSEDEYVEKAVELASDLPRLLEIRRNLRPNMLNSPLCDGPGHTLEVEAAYREMWKIWCKDEPDRRKKRRQAGVSETEPHKPLLRIIHALGNPSFTQFCQCLGMMEHVSMLNDMHPLGMQIFSPLTYAQDRFRLFGEDEWEVVSRKEMTFSESMLRIYGHLKRRDENLVITDWSHLDFIARPFMPAPTYEVFVNSDVERDFTVRDIYFVRHPLIQWVAYCELTNVSKHVSVEEFLVGYHRFAEQATRGKWYRCEDFAENPGDILKDVCQHLELPFDPEYVDTWPFNSSVNGDLHDRTLEARAYDKLQAPVLLDNYPSLRAQMEKSADYGRILELLGYDQ
ncbi:MAG: tetratricopeptide repeat protein [Rhodospirillaceae bacterium]|nr:tetratricopeptide repeat protein [Rhodospirillaceae bacterium]